MKGKREHPPFLLIGYGPLDDQKHSVYCVIDNRWNSTVIPMLSDKQVVPSNYGWLALLDILTDDCSLWNPKTGEIIQLPRLPNSWMFDQCVLSKPPTEADCHILFRSFNMAALSFCQIDDDEFLEMSTRNDKDVDRVYTLISFHGNIYALVGFKLRLVTVSFVGKFLKFRPMLKSGQPWRIYPSFRPWSDEQKFYLVESPLNNDEMLLVCKMDPVLYLPQITDFKIFRIDIKRLECVELMDIGERTIFLSNTGNAFCHSSLGMGMKPNSIYYTHRRRNLRVYSLGKRSITNLPPCLAPSSRFSKTCWIQHSFSIS